MMTTFGVVVFYVSVDEKFVDAKYHKIRGIMFLLFGISAGGPIIYMRLTSGIKGLEIPYDFTFFIIGGISYIIGGSLYTIKVPERIWPGKFCIIGNSHQIFHFLVLVGVFTHYMGCIETYNYRMLNTCPAS